jgi:hypothetical protein
MASQPAVRRRRSWRPSPRSEILNAVFDRLYSFTQPTSHMQDQPHLGCLNRDLVQTMVSPAVLLPERFIVGMINTVTEDGQANHRS